METEAIPRIIVNGEEIAPPTAPELVAQLIATYGNNDVPTLLHGIEDADGQRLRDKLQAINLLGELVPLSTTEGLELKRRLFRKAADMHRGSLIRASNTRMKLGATSLRNLQPAHRPYIPFPTHTYYPFS